MSVYWIDLAAGLLLSALAGLASKPEHRKVLLILAVLAFAVSVGMAVWVAAHPLSR